MQVGFTGTRQGMTRLQKEAVESIMKAFLAFEGEPVARHGDCVGADAEFHEIALSLGYKVIIHPPEKGDLRALCEGAFFTEPERAYLDRNKEIVRRSDVLVVAPATHAEEVRSGTWATYRYAKKLLKYRYVIPPNGLLRKEI